MYKFNLQLFNDDDGDAGTTNQDSGGKVEKVGLDDAGNVKIFYDNQDDADNAHDDSDDNDGRNTDDAAGDENKADPDEGDKGTPEGEQAQYTPEELRTTDLANIDPSRLPPELLPWYKAMQAPITRKNQELSEAIKSVQQFVDEAKTRQAEPEQPQIDAKQFYSMQHEFLCRQVAQAFKIDHEEFSRDKRDWSDEVQLAYDDALLELKAAARAKVEALEKAEKEKNEINAKADALEAELRAIDNDVVDHILTKLQNGEMPERDAKAIRTAIKSGDKTTVTKYFEDLRKEYYAAKNGIKTGEKVKETGQAPRLERKGTGKVSDAPKEPDWRELGKIENFDDKLAWIFRKNNIKA